MIISKTMIQTEFWLNFRHTKDGITTRLPRGLPLYELSHDTGNPRMNAFYAPAMEAFKEHIEKLGPLENMKQGESIVIGQMGPLEVVIYRSASFPSMEVDTTKGILERVVERKRQTRKSK